MESCQLFLFSFYFIDFTLLPLIYFSFAFNLHHLRCIFVQPQGINSIFFNCTLNILRATIGKYQYVEKYSKRGSKAK